MNENDIQQKVEYYPKPTAKEIFKEIPILKIVIASLILSISYIGSYSTLYNTQLKSTEFEYINYLHEKEVVDVIRESNEWRQPINCIEFRSNTDVKEAKEALHYLIIMSSARDNLKLLSAIFTIIIQAITLPVIFFDS